MNDFLNNLEAVGERLRLERVRMALRQDQFAELGGVKRVSQSQYEGGNSPFSIEYLLNLQRHGVDIGFVVTGYRNDGSLGYTEQSLLDMFAKLPGRKQSTIFELLSHMTDSYADLSELPARGQSLHGRRLGYKPPPEDR